VFFDVHGVNLFVEMFEGGNDRLGNAFQHDFIHIVDVSFPNGGFLINIDFGVDFTDQFMNLVSIFFDILHLLGKDPLLLGVVVVHRHRSVLSFKHFDVDVIETGFDLGDGFFHDLDHFEGIVDMFFGVGDKFGDIGGIPFQLFQSRGQRLVHLFNAILD